MLIKIVQMQERHTHTHTHTYTPHTERKMTFKRVSLGEKSNTAYPLFRRTPLFYKPLIVMGKILAPPPSLFGKSLNTYAPSLSPSLLYKGWISTMQTPHICTCLKLLINGFEKVYWLDYQQTFL